MRIARAALLGAVFLGTGCYHATIETGATPSTEVVEEQWAPSFVYGLVPPKTMETAAKCTSGVARVETQHSFLNGLVAVLTFGIFTPMTIKATCATKRTAQGDGDPVIRVGYDASTIEEAFRLAVNRSRTEGRPVDVQY